MIHTTFRLAKEAGACGQRLSSDVGYNKVGDFLGGAKKYGMDRPIPLTTVLESNGLADALWCLRATVEDYETVVKPFLRRYLADILEHLTEVSMGDESKALLREGVALLRDAATESATLKAYTTRAAWVANRATLAAEAAAAAEVATWAAEAAEVILAANRATLAANRATRAAEAAAAAEVATWATAAAEAAEAIWQAKRFKVLLTREVQV